MGGTRTNTCTPVMGEIEGWDTTPGAPQTVVHDGCTASSLFMMGTWVHTSLVMMGTWVHTSLVMMGT